MTIRELIKSIKTSKYLDDEQKKSLLFAIPDLEDKQLAEIAAVIEEGNDLEESMALQKDLVITAFANIFTGMNRYALKETTKSLFKSAEEAQGKSDDQRLESLINELDHDK